MYAENLALYGILCRNLTPLKTISLTPSLTLRLLLAPNYLPSLMSIEPDCMHNATTYNTQDHWISSILQPSN